MRRSGVVQQAGPAVEVIQRIPVRVEPHTVLQQISNIREGLVGYEAPTWRRD